MIAIIESPYAASNRGTIDDHVKYARACCLDSIQRGETPYASHLFYPQFMNDDNAAERAHGIGMGYNIARACLRYGGGIVAFYSDYGWSAGMRAAYDTYAPLGYTLETRAIYGVPVPMPSPFVMQLGC